MAEGRESPKSKKGYQKVPNPFLSPVFEPINKFDEGVIKSAMEQLYQPSDQDFPLIPGFDSNVEADPSADDSLLPSVTPLTSLMDTPVDTGFMGDMSKEAATAVLNKYKEMIDDGAFIIRHNVTNTSEYQPSGIYYVSVRDSSHESGAQHFRLIVTENKVQITNHPEHFKLFDDFIAHYSKQPLIPGCMLTLVQPLTSYQLSSQPIEELPEGFMKEITSVEEVKDILINARYGDYVIGYFRESYIMVFVVKNLTGVCVLFLLPTRWLHANYSLSNCEAFMKPGFGFSNYQHLIKFYKERSISLCPESNVYLGDNVLKPISGARRKSKRDEEGDEYIRFPWYMGKMKRQEADQQLAASPPGTFLIRYRLTGSSSFHDIKQRVLGSAPTMYSLAVQLEKAHHFNIHSFQNDLEETRYYLHIPVGFPMIGLDSKEFNEPTLSDLVLRWRRDGFIKCPVKDIMTQLLDKRVANIRRPENWSFTIGDKVFEYPLGGTTESSVE